MTKLPNLIKEMKLIFTVCMLLMPAFSLIAQTTNDWSATWGASPEYTGAGDMPGMSLANNSIRQVVRTSLAGDRIRLRLTNFHSSEPVDIQSVYIAVAGDSSDIIPSTARYLSFGGKRSVSIQPGVNITSDVADFTVDRCARVAITITYGAGVPEHATSHRGSRTTSYIAKGAVSPSDRFGTVEAVDHWYNILSLEVEGRSDVIAVLGNSITDGRGSTTNMQNRWTDRMAEELPHDCGVVNLGIGGNSVLEGGISEPLVRRYKDELSFHSGITHLIIYEGTNDIGSSRQQPDILAGRLIEAYKEIVAYAHSWGIRVYIATITPTKGHSYYSEAHEQTRLAVNNWIRKAEGFEGVIDFDRLVRDKKDREQLRKEYSDDWLHLNPQGYKVMGMYAAKIMGKDLNKRK